METQSSKCQNMREFRRLRTVELFESGMKQVDIARVLGATKGAVSQWLSVYREKGLDALRYRKTAKHLAEFSMSKKMSFVVFLPWGRSISDMRGMYGHCHALGNLFRSNSASIIVRPT